MPEIGFLIWLAIAITALAVVLSFFSWLIAHPLAVIAIVGLFVVLGVYRRQRNRV